MRPSFHPRLVNNPFGDPGLFIPFLYDNRAILFDLGDIQALSARDILKTTHIFVTHTHMDHFIGFDRLLRLCLGREKTLHLFGPEGFLKNVEGKLAGYRWNLVAHYPNRFLLNVTEVGKNGLSTKQYLCGNKFLNENKTQKAGFNGTLTKEPGFSVSAVILDHRIPCLGLSILEKFHVNIKKEAIRALGLDIGPWLKEFKQALFNNQEPGSEFDVTFGQNRKMHKRFRLEELTRRIAIISPGQKITYVTDVRYNDSEFRKIRDFAKGSDQLFIETAFLEKDARMAREKYHLTTRQAGTIAGHARAKRIIPFHFSPRYTNQAHLLSEETQAAYKKALKESSPPTDHG
jgi:ribonuclease Z